VRALPDPVAEQADDQERGKREQWNEGVLHL
jgi:hypothetical protein